MLVKEFSGKTEKEAIAKALEELNLTEDQVRIELLDKGKRNIFGIGEEVPATIRVYYDEITLNLSEFENIVYNIIKLLGVNATVKAKEETDTKIHVNVLSDDPAILIGKKGSILEALQFVISLIASKHFKNVMDKHIILDIDGYRERREETLKHKARQAASQVKRTKKTITLEPMSPYERRIVHLELQNDNDVETKSDGEPPYKSIKVYFKKGRNINNNQYNNRNYNRYKHNNS